MPSPPSVRGWVYILTNPAFPHLVKIGCTGRSPAVRCRELTAATGVPAPFSVAWAAPVADFARCEALVHAKLDRLRSNSSREFFRCDVSTARAMIEQAAAALLRPWWWRLLTGWSLSPPRPRGGYARRRQRGTNGLPLLVALAIAGAAVWIAKPAPPSWMPVPIARTLLTFERL